MEGIVFDIQRYSIHDGPGIRTTVFLKGCPLSCPWCHNPEGMATAPEVIFFPARCVGCGACLAVCPQRALTRVADRLQIDPTRCRHCGCCVAACPAGARRMAGERLGVEETLARVERDRPFYQTSGGGVTFSGGEPLLQADFLLACLRECQRRGLHSAVDTSGFAPRALMRQVARTTDLILFDLKTLDGDRHRADTGVPLGPILENLAALDRDGGEIWIRLPLIPGFNDDQASLAAIGSHVAALTSTRRLHLLPYHRWGAGKGERLTRPPMPASRSLEPPLPDAVAEAARLLAGLGLDVRIGG